MRGAGELIGVVLTGGLLLADDPVGVVLAALDGVLHRSGGLHGRTIVGQHIVRCADAALFPVDHRLNGGVHHQRLVCVDELRLAGCDGVDELFLKVAGQEHVRQDGLYDVAADIRHLGVALQHAAVLVNDVVHTVHGKGLDGGLGGRSRPGGLHRRSGCVRGLALGLLLKGRVGLQRGIDELEAQCIALVGGADHVLVGDTDHRAAGGDGVEILALRGQGIVRAAVGKRLAALLDSQHGLRLHRAGKLIGILCLVAEIRVLRHHGKFLIDLIIAVEELILAVGGDEAADEGEDEHEDENAHAHHRQTVAEEALGDQCAGGQHLHAAIVVEGILLVVGLLGIFLVVLVDLAHSYVSPLLRRCARAGQPRRTERRRSGCPAGSAPTGTRGRTWRTGCRRSPWPDKRCSRCRGWQTASP